MISVITIYEIIIFVLFIFIGILIASLQSKNKIIRNYKSLCDKYSTQLSITNIRFKEELDKRKN